MPAITLSDLADRPMWIGWRPETTSEGKPTKTPYNPKTKGKAASDKSATWATRKDAEIWANGEIGRGISVVITRINDDLSLSGIDLDTCRNPDTGVLTPWAQEVVDRFATYTEISPSRTGVKLFFAISNAVYAAADPLFNGRGGRVFKNGDKSEHPPAIEVYRGKRFFAVTGQSIGLTDDLRVVDLADLQWLIEDAGPRFRGKKSKGNGADHSRSGKAFHAGATLKASGASYAALRAALLDHEDPGVADWARTKGLADGERELRRIFDNADGEADELSRMNEKHAVLSIGGKTRVLSLEEDLIFSGRKSMSFSSLKDFEELHNKYRHSYLRDGKLMEEPLGTWWLRNPHRRQYDGGIRFMPTRDEPVVGDVRNLWQGFNVAARKPDGGSGASGCKLFLDHARLIICSGDEGHFDYLMKREALIAQKRIRSEIAVALRTQDEGTGKGTWCQTLNYLYGPHAMEVANPDHVIGKHNAHLESLLRLTADEALFARDPHHRNGLYSLITEPTLTIEPKFIGAYPALNHLNIDVVSNKDHFVPVSGTARRLFMPSVSSARKGDFEYFRRIRAQLENEGGYEALLYHLLYEIDIRDFNVRAVPKTAALAEQAAYSRQGVDRLVEEACSTGLAPCQRGEAGFSECTSVNTNYERFEGFDDYIDHHNDRELRSLGSLAVKRRLAKDWGCMTGKAARKTDSGIRKNGVRWPPLSTLRAMFEKKHGAQTWLDPDTTEWHWAGGANALEA